eukprot:268410_1
MTSSYVQVLKHFNRKKLLTLCEVIDFKQKRVLLGMKKKGFGAGNFNGFGGKVEQNETILQAAKRECKEEANIDLIDCNKIGIIYFSFTYLDELFEVHVYYSTKWNGKECETNEMKPQWFKFSDIPYDNMWKDDIFWMPYLFRSQQPEYFIGAAYFDKENVMLNYDFKSIHDDKQQINWLLSEQYDKLKLDYSVLINKKTQKDIDMNNDNESECKEQ